MHKDRYQVGDLVKSNHIAGMLSQRGLGIIIEHKAHGHRVNAYRVHWAEIGKATWEAGRLIQRVANVNEK